MPLAAIAGDSAHILLDEDRSEGFNKNIPYGWPQSGRNSLLELKYGF